MSSHQLLSDTCSICQGEVEKSFSVGIYKNTLCLDLAEGESSGKHRNEMVVPRVVPE